MEENKRKSSNQKVDAGGVLMLGYVAVIALLVLVGIANAYY